MSDNPSATFFFKDWRDDIALRQCGFFAHGVWMFMLCFAHNDGEDYGFVLIEGEQLTPEAIALLKGCPRDHVVAAYSELERAKVFSRDKQGRVYCRRMVRWAKLSEVRAEAGAKGAASRWGNDQKPKRNSRMPKERRSKPVTHGKQASDNGVANGVANNASPFSLLHSPIEERNDHLANGKTVDPDQGGKDHAPPSPVPSSQGPGPSVADRARADAVTFAEALGVSLTADASRMHWPDTLARAVEVEGLDWQRDILPAAREARAKGKPHLAYALAIARSYRDAGRASGASGVPVNGHSSVSLPEDGDAGWRLRLKLCVQEALADNVPQRERWPLTWGPFPFTNAGLIEPTTLVPVHILQGILDDKRRREGQSS